MTVALALLGAVAVWAPAPAHADVSQARLAVGTGLRLNFGGLGDDFAWGWQIVEVEAAVQPLSLLRGALRLGPAWWTIISRYGATSGTAIDSEVSLLQMGLGLRAAWALPLGAWPISVHALLGGEFLRASHPVPPSDTGTYFGPALQLGLEYGNGVFFWGAQANWDLVANGPTGVYVLLFVGLGSK